MKINKIEISVIALTLAFVCFAAGFFTGRRKAVVITEYSAETALSVSVADVGDEMQTDGGENGENKRQTEIGKDTEAGTLTDGLKDAQAEPQADSGADTDTEAEPVTDGGMDEDAEAVTLTDGREDEESKPPDDSREDTVQGLEPTPDTSVTTQDTQKENHGKLNINTASHQALTGLPGIGDVLAGRIIEYRDTYGAFANVYDIMNVSGIGDKRFEAIKDLIFAG